MLLYCKINNCKINNLNFNNLKRLQIDKVFILRNECNIFVKRVIIYRYYIILCLFCFFSFEKITIFVILQRN